jgi:elongation factor G
MPVNLPVNLPVNPTSPSQLRNVVLVGHGGAGKTSVAEALLFGSGATSRLGSVDHETSLLDFEPEEHRRKGSIASKLAWMVHEGHKINLLDTPGDQNFAFDAIHMLHGADAAVVVLSAPDGVEQQTERFYAEAASLGLPRALFINKMDRDRADPAACLTEAREVLGVKAVPVQVPIGAGHGFRGVVSLFQRRAFVYRADGSGKYDKVDVPAELEDEVETAWHTLLEAVAESDEVLLERYLETFELSPEDVKAGFQRAVKRGDIVPVIYGAATAQVGAAALLELITWAFPSPLESAPIRGRRAGADASVAPSVDGPFLAQVIHTTVDELQGKTSIFRVFSGHVPADGGLLNPRAESTERLGAVFALRGREREPVAALVVGDIVGVSRLKDTHTGDTLCDPHHSFEIERLLYPASMMSYVVNPTSRADGDKLRGALDRLLEEDPTLTLGHDELTHHLVLHGMGQAHLDMAIERMKRKYKVSVETSIPPVPYRETLKKAVSAVEGRHKKQTGGAGQFGVCVVNVLPLDRDEGFRFVDAIKGGAIPNQFIPSVEKGVVARMKSGFLAGYPIVDIVVELTDGKYHSVDSKDIAFQFAGSKALKAAFERGGTRILEPIMQVSIVCPSETMGDVLGDMNGRRGRVSGMETRGKNTVIEALAPLAEVQRYAPELRSLTGGKGTFTLQLHGYEEVPGHLTDKIVHSSPFKRKEEEEDED